MAEDSGDVLRRSLDAVDRHRRRSTVALVAAGVLLVATVFYGVHTAGMNTVQSVLAHFLMLIIWVTGLTLIVMLQINAMTKRILRAIELAARK